MLADEGIGCIAFSPLAQGLLTDRYLDGIPEGSRAAKPHGFLRPEHVTDEAIAQVRQLNEIAKEPRARPWPRWRSAGSCASRWSPPR